MKLTRETKGMPIPKYTVNEIERNMSQEDAEIIYALDYREISEEDKRKYRQIYAKEKAVHNALH